MPHHPIAKGTVSSWPQDAIDEINLLRRMLNAADAEVEKLRVIVNNLRVGDSK